ncbi:MAG: anhydro-N-acetylmuramic acid kinase [Cytophagaceae bacterium]|nr:anhydro-N-acetylmuramic acid kinase [Cytophagaceae bacterium]MDW8456302.1 anhydro-N-acetylmuramic acid kinase [Cytophagaceae bacterium]
MREYRAIGLMSGTSLDGLDLAYCIFKKSSGGWKYDILCAHTHKYTDKKRERLKNAMHTSGLELVKTDMWFAHMCAEQVKKFIHRHSIDVDFIASHGHTVFHAPGEGYTTQIGSGAYISALTGLPVVSDFRTVDVALGGNGAPLVPVGDELLFSNFDMCLNLGGIANISYKCFTKRVAYDICPANIVLNYFAEKLGKQYDKDGAMAKRGRVNTELLRKLNAWEYYKQHPPKSLGRECIEQAIFPMLTGCKISEYDVMATFTEHIAVQVAKSISDNNGKNIVVTGGGAFNTFLMERVAYHLPDHVKLTIPGELIVKYKEALIFAFLGLLKLRNEVNIFKSVTGAYNDSVGGALYGLHPYL